MRNGRTSNPDGPNMSGPLRLTAATKSFNSWNAVMNPSGKTSHDLPEVVLLIKLRKQYLQQSKNTMIARVTLHNMRQDRDEPVRNFSAKLRGQAGVCKFVITCLNCNHEVNYTDNIVRDVLARGIADPDIQLDLLGDKNQNMTL